MTKLFESTVVKAQDVLHRQIGEEAVVLHMEKEQYMGFDEIANRMWQVLTTSPSIQAAYDILLAEFDVEADKLRRDLDDFVQELVHLGLVHVENHS